MEKMIDRRSVLKKKIISMLINLHLQMAITERLWRDFLLWTLLGFNVQRIWFDNDFAEKMIGNAIAFHESILVPENFEMRVPMQLIPFNLNKP